MTKNYFKSDGNGGYNIGKYTLAIISIMSIIIGMIIPSVFGYGKLNAKMDFVIEELAEQREIHKVTNDKLFLIEKNQILYSFKIEDTTERCDILEQYHN